MYAREEIQIYSFCPYFIRNLITAPISLMR